MAYGVKIRELKGIKKYNSRTRKRPQIAESIQYKIVLLVFEPIRVRNNSEICFLVLIYIIAVLFYRFLFIFTFSINFTIVVIKVDNILVKSTYIKKTNVNFGIAISESPRVPIFVPVN